MAGILLLTFTLLLLAAITSAVPKGCGNYIDPELCRPAPKTKERECRNLMHRCRCQHGIALKWVHGGGCDGLKKRPSGCQCSNYCDIACKDKCLRNGCKWKNNKCANIDGYSGPLSTCPVVPTRKPTFKPTRRPTNAPTLKPTKSPTETPTKSPTRTPTYFPTLSPDVTPEPTLSPFPYTGGMKSPTIRREYEYEYEYEHKEYEGALKPTLTPPSPEEEGKEDEDDARLRMLLDDAFEKKDYEFAF